MPETRYNEIWDGQGHLISRIPYELSDLQLELERIQREVLASNDQALVAYQHYDNLVAAQKDKILKALLGEYIVNHRERYGG